MGLALVLPVELPALLVLVRVPGKAGLERAAAMGATMLVSPECTRPAPHQET